MQKTWNTGKNNSYIKPMSNALKKKAKYFRKRIPRAQGTKGSRLRKNTIAGNKQ